MAALSARVAELLAMLDRTGGVRVGTVEPLPEGRVAFELRVIDAPPALPPVGAPPLGAAVELATRVADLLMQADAAGMQLQRVTTAGVEPSLRAEVVAVGTLLRATLAPMEGALPPVLATIIRRATDAAAPDRYQAVGELRADLQRLQQALPVPTRGGSVEFTATARLLGAMEVPEVITVTNVAPLPDGRIGYALRQLLDGEPALRPGLATATDVAALTARLGEALGQGREAGLVLRELTSRGVTLTFAGQEGRAELVALGTVLRDLMRGADITPSPALAAAIARALDPESPERFERLEELRDELARQAQVARLLHHTPPPVSAPPRTLRDAVLWTIGAILLVTVAVLLLR